MQVIPQEKIQAASKGLRGIAHELRLTVLCHLLDGPMCVSELMDATGASQSNLSQHLARMRMMGILVNEKRGKQVYYAIADPAFVHLLETLRCIYCHEACNGGR